MQSTVTVARIPEWRKHAPTVQEFRIQMRRQILGKEN